MNSIKQPASTKSKRYQKSLFIFRRDLRCNDNTALIRALTDSQAVIACFIFDPRQIDPHPYQSQPGLAFLLESLADLQEQMAKRQGTLYFFKGEAHDIVDKLIVKEHIQAVYVNEDYTPFSTSRDLAIKKVCHQHQIEFDSFSDALLNPPRSVSKDSGGVYTIFTPYFRKAAQLDVPPAVKNQHTNFVSQELAVSAVGLPQPNSNAEGTGRRKIKGGRKQAFSILKDIGVLKDYVDVRDIPVQDATSHLSAHHKFGTCSIRETYEAASRALGRNHAFIRQLYWRDFLTYIAYHYPHVFGASFYPQYDSLRWSDNQEHFKRWCTGMTGFPIVDAGMRELNETGFMHNRVRMITASFLVKDLHIHWLWGERYFAQKLVDYDPCVNNGSWQW
ncbi:MAG: deoxyribodipyrimidine photo-lyase, partial [Candidatus Omnitrophica bacterium]|nr:deoxyribodipyrimidine photo-lyase [Candidatus Omnitrophota bacterium]